MNSKTPQFHPGDRVIYVPGHANYDVTHPDCESGRVSAIGRTGIVFVVFSDAGSMGRAKACDAATLVLAGFQGAKA